MRHTRSLSKRCSGDCVRRARVSWGFLFLSVCLLNCIYAQLLTHIRQLRFSGKKRSSLSGEEEEKNHHQFPHPLFHLPSMSFPLHFFPSSRAGRSSFYAPDLHIAGQPANSLATLRYASKQASMHACMHQASQPLSHPPTHPPSDRVARAATRPRTPSRYIGYIPDRPTDRPTDPAS
ncbi:hypothetical protein BKA81DRAFT_346746, partial [Phyllosticta paracitricarpa]